MIIDKRVSVIAPMDAVTLYITPDTQEDVARIYEAKRLYKPYVFHAPVEFAGKYIVFDTVNMDKFEEHLRK